MRVLVGVGREGAGVSGADGVVAVFATERDQADVPPGLICEREKSLWAVVHEHEVLQQVPAQQCDEWSTARPRNPLRCQVGTQ